MSPARVTGLVALALGMVLPLTTACFCGPAVGPPPSTETCPAATGLTASSVRLFRHGGEELLDGSTVPEFFGAQGGMHWGFDLLVTADGAGDCVDVDLELRVGSRDAAIATEFSGGVRSRIVSEGVRTSQIVLFPVAGASDTPIFATATAYGATRTVRLCLSSECGSGFDAGVIIRPDAPFFFDVPGPDAPFFDTDAP